MECVYVDFFGFERPQVSLTLVFLFFSVNRNET